MRAGVMVLSPELVSTVPHIMRGLQLVKIRDSKLICHVSSI